MTPMCPRLYQRLFKAMGFGVWEECRIFKRSLEAGGSSREDGASRFRKTVITARAMGNMLIWKIGGEVVVCTR